MIIVSALVLLHAILAGIGKKIKGTREREGEVLAVDRRLFVYCYMCTYFVRNLYAKRVKLFQQIDIATRRNIAP